MTAWRRRLMSVPAVTLGFAGLGLSAPTWLPLSLLVGAVRRRRFVLTRVLCFGWIYAGMETAGLALTAGAWLTKRGDRAALRDAAYRIQGWWAGTLYRSMCRVLDLRFEVEGEEALEPSPFILLIRHTSIMDTLLPAALVANPRGTRLRYVLKSELLVDPCLDIVGHILPNHFVDRSQPSADDIEAIRGLTRNLDARDGAVIYPEGTRFSAKKRARILERLRERGSRLYERAQALERTLPPRLGGVAALLDGNPEVDVVVCTHEGLDGFATLADLASGAVVGRTIRVAFWRIPAASIPREHEARGDWLFDIWAEIDERARQT